MTSVEVRAGLVRALELDLVGPAEGLGDPREILAQVPSRWYLNGFLVPVDAPVSQRADEMVADELEAPGEGTDTDEDSSSEGPSSKKSFFPSSCGLSFLVPQGVACLTVRVSWGDYQRVTLSETDERAMWHRTPRQEQLLLKLPNRTSRPIKQSLPSADGLEVVLLVRPVSLTGGNGGLPAGARSVSVFLVNRRTPAPDIRREEAFAFQVMLEVECEAGFLARPNPRGVESKDWDERVADLQYQNVCDHGVGHSVSVQAVMEGLLCRLLRTCWLPSHQVERVAPAKLKNITLKMDELAGGVFAEH